MTYNKCVMTESRHHNVNRKMVKIFEHNLTQNNLIQTIGDIRVTDK